MSKTRMNFDKAFIIAEAGTCHADDSPAQRFSTAIDYVFAAFDAGADAIKFQMFDNPNKDTMFCWLDGDEERSERWKESRLSLEEWGRVKDLCDELGIMFLVSVFEYQTVKWLTALDVKATKVASRAAGNLDEFLFAPTPLLVSNGMWGVKKVSGVVILECEANYPSIARWKDGYTGFSDHSGNPWRAIDALARGCKLVEVHFYIDPTDAGPDLLASLTYEELKLVCEAKDAIN